MLPVSIDFNSIYFHTMEVIGFSATVWLPTFFCRRKNLMQVWKSLRMSKWWQKFCFGRNCLWYKTAVFGFGQSHKPHPAFWHNSCFTPPLSFSFCFYTAIKLSAVPLLWCWRGELKHKGLSTKMRLFGSICTSHFPPQTTEQSLARHLDSQILSSSFWQGEDDRMQILISVLRGMKKK